MSTIYPLLLPPSTLHFPPAHLIVPLLSYGVNPLQNGKEHDLRNVDSSRFSYVVWTLRHFHPQGGKGEGGGGGRGEDKQTKESARHRKEEAFL